ncbi:hypothetical protein TruAng_009735 [Truncatella angustata]|nr:hypothetical protein TruAng_009735 [Truncatella angustata]
MSSRSTYSASAMPMTPAPPSDLPSYARLMHQHTKKQMENASRSSHRRGHRSNHRSNPSLPDGDSQSSGDRSPDGIEYHD